MKKRIALWMLAAALAGGLFQSACKKSDDTGEATLVVSVSAGASGTPASGSYTHQVGDTVTYSYLLVDGYSDLTVLYDGTAVGASGTLTMTAGSHTLQAYATGANTYTLAVTTSTGVTGTPASGTTTHVAGDKVDYSYALEEGYINLVVTLDGQAAPASGTITFPESHSLVVLAERQYDVLGTWTLSESYTDGSSWEGPATFSGSVSSGTVVDSQGGSGTFTCTASVINFTIEHPEVTYTYTGSFSGDTAASGTCKRIKKSDTASYYTGTWTLSKADGASARLAGGRGKNG